jgi:hypothetical protein
MDAANTSGAQNLETPIERAVEQEEREETPKWQAQRDRAEANAVLSDIKDFVAQSDPASLPEAQAELSAWKIPVDAPYSNDPKEDENAPLTSVYSVSSESEAYIVRGLLEAAGVPAMLREVDAPIYGSSMPSGEGRWGDILVAQHLADEARQIIASSIEPGSTGAND